jgi:RHS repeat-associated protein
MSNPLQAGISNYAENRMRQAGTGGPVYRYGADGPWVMRAAYNAASQWIVPTNTDVWFHLRDPFGRLRSIKRYKDKGSAGVDWVTDKQYDYFLDRMQDRATKTWYGRDRLGSVRAVVKPSGSTWAVTQRISYFPYGQEQGVESANDTFKFGTYWREGVLDDAQQRWYGSKWGRFASADPYEGSRGADAPGSWNQYADVAGDPVNYYDPRGLDGLAAGFCSGMTSAGIGGAVTAMCGMMTAPQPSVGDIYNSSGLGLGMPSPSGGSSIIGSTSPDLISAEAEYVSTIAPSTPSTVPEWWEVVWRIPSVNPIYWLIALSVMQTGGSGSNTHGKWYCTASCNVQCQPGCPLQIDRISGEGWGADERQATLAAQYDANRNLATLMNQAWMSVGGRPEGRGVPGCYKRHCSYKCSQR